MYFTKNIVKAAIISLVIFKYDILKLKMKKKNEILVVEESAVVKNQVSEIPMLAASSSESENYVS